MDYKILIVDDIPKNIQLLANILTQEGYEVEFATGGAEAIDWVSHGEFDLILLDVMMPDMNGFEVCREIKSIPDKMDIPVIFLTARTDIESITRGFKAGAVDYITKPFEKDELICRVRNHLELKNLRDQLIQMNEQLESIVEVRTEELRLNNRKLEIALAKFKTIFQNSSDAIYLIDKRQRIMEANDKFCEISGLNRETLIKSDPESLNGRIPGIPAGQMEQMLTRRSSDFTVRYAGTKGRTYDLEYHGTLITIDQMECLLLIAHDVTIRNQLHKKVVSAVLKTEEKERQRFAKDLHDGLGPILSTAKFYVRNLESEPEGTERNVLCSRINETLDEAMTNLKLISRNLSPYILRDFGLEIAIGEFKKNKVLDGKIKFDYTSNVKKRFDLETETMLYRIFTELYNNTLKYSGASEIRVELVCYDNWLHLIYTDNGCGFDMERVRKENTGMGISNIYTRAASLDGQAIFTTMKDQGLTVEIQIPLDHPDKSEQEFL